MQSVWEESLQTIRREDKWFRAAEEGTDDAITTMRELIGQDPNRFYGDWDPRKLVNCGRREEVMECSR